jgi:hypothetical protein
MAGERPSTDATGSENPFQNSPATTLMVEPESRMAYNDADPTSRRWPIAGQPGTFETGSENPFHK